MRLVRILGVSPLALVMVCTAAQASVIDFAGTTAGCFGSSCTPGSTASDGHGLSFRGVSFSTSITSPATTTSVDDLGKLTLTDTGLLHIDTNEAFDLKVTFTEPASTVSFTADITGVISFLASEVTIKFNPNTLSFDNSLYTLDINNISLATSFLSGGRETKDLTGTIALASPGGPGLNGVSAVPEPSTWAMMMIGFAALGFWAHRRRSIVALAQ